MTRDELIDLLSDVTTLLGTALAQHVALREGIRGAGVEAQELKVDATKQQYDAAKERLKKLKDAAQRKRELEKIRGDHERSAWRPTANEAKNSGVVTLRAASGRVIGYMRAIGPNRTDFFLPSGQLVAREVGDVTYDGRGKVAYRGKLGLVVLGYFL